MSNYLWDKNTNSIYSVSSKMSSSDALELIASVVLGFSRDHYMYNSSMSSEHTYALIARDILQEFGTLTEELTALKESTTLRLLEKEK